MLCKGGEGRGRGKRREGRGRGKRREGKGRGRVKRRGRGRRVSEGRGGGRGVREKRGGGNGVREGRGGEGGKRREGVLTAALPTPYATLKRYLKPPADDTLTMSPCFAGTIILAACHAAT